MQSDEQVKLVWPPARSSKAVRGRRSVLAVLGALVVVLLSGCLNYSADVTVSKDDQVSGAVILTRQVKPMGGVEVLPSPAPLPPGAPGSNPANKIEFPKPVSTTDSIVVTPYSDGINVGYKIEYRRATFKETAAFAPLEDRGGALVFTRDGDTVKFAASFDLTFDAGTEAQTALLAQNVAATVKLDFPGTVGDSNGAVADQAVTWTVEPLTVNDLAATYTSAPPTAPTANKSAAAASAPKNSIPTTTWIITGAVILGLLIIGGVTFGVLRRRGTRMDAAKAATSGLEAPQGPDDTSGPTAPYGPVRQTYPPPRTPAPALTSPPRFSAPSPMLQSSVSVPPSPTASRTTTYAVTEQKREHREPLPESLDEVPEASAMITETPPANAPALHGGWPPPQPKWMQEP